MTSRPRLPIVLSVIGALIGGCGVAVQSRVNGQLGAELDNGYLAAVISFGSGLLILTVAMLFSAGARRGLRTVLGRVRAGTTPWWYLAGGAGGSLLVLSQGLASAALGVALFSIGIVCGQTVSGVLVDRIGIGTAAPRPVTLQRVLGAALALVAVAIAGSAQLGDGSSFWLLLLLPFVSGLAVAWQQAVNGQVKAAAGSTIAASFVNFVVGTTVLLVALVIHTAFVGLPEALPTNPVLYIGGAVGVTFIALAAAIVGITGVLLLTLATISGQLIMSIVLDLVVPAEGHDFHWSALIGTGVALVAVVIVATATRAPRGTSPS